MIDPESRRLIAMMVEREAGLHFRSSHLSDLDRGILKTAEELQFKDIRAFIRELLEMNSNDHLLEVLINHLTIGETYFFREKQLLEVFRTQIIPGLQQRSDAGDRPLTVWSAGCCSGEEPYTLAIILRESGYRQENLKSRVIATDINRTFLEKAVRGEYSNWSFRETPPDFRKKYFSHADRVVTIHKEIRDMVNFSRFNLIDGNPGIHGLFPGSADVIFCRNVLMYFSSENVQKTYKMFYEILAPEGYLFVSPVEVPMQPPAGFRFFKSGEVILMQKLPPGTVSETVQVPAFHHMASKSGLVVTPEERVIVPKEHIKKTPAISAKSQSRPAVAPDHKGVEHRHTKKEKENTNHHHQLVQLIRSHANAGEFDQALKYCGMLLEKEPAAASGYYMQASIFTEMKAVEKAEESLRKALYLHPGFIMAHFSLGLLYRRTGREKQAARHFTNLLHLLDKIPEEEVPECADGMAAWRLKEMTEQLLTI